MLFAHWFLPFGLYLYYNWELYQREYQAAIILTEEYKAFVAAVPSSWIFGYFFPSSDDSLLLPIVPSLSVEYFPEYGTLYAPIIAVELADCTVDDRVWNLLGNFPFLDDLRICNSAIRVDKGVDFSRFTRLEGLSIEDTRLTIHDIESLPRMPKLRDLCLYRAGARDDWLITISQCHNLEYLWLAGDITDKGVGYLAVLKELRDLGLPKTRISSKSCRIIAKLPKLEILDLADTAVDDEGMKYLADMQSLRELMLRGTPITDEGVERLSSLRNLEALYLDNTRVTRASLPILSFMQALRPDWVTADGTAIDQEEMERWRESQRKLKSPNGKEKHL